MKPVNAQSKQTSAGITNGLASSDTERNSWTPIVNNEPMKTTQSNGFHE